jgi:hypothetical protein
VVRGVVERVVGRDRSSRCCIGVCGGMVDVVWRVDVLESSGIDEQMSNVGGAACTGLFGGGRRPPSNRVYMPSTCKKMSISKS